MPELDSVEKIAHFLWPKHPTLHLAALLNVPPRDVRDWFKGYRRIPRDKSQELSAYLTRLALQVENTLNRHTDKITQEKNKNRETRVSRLKAFNVSAKPQPIRL